MVKRSIGASMLYAILALGVPTSSGAEEGFGVGGREAGEFTLSDTVGKNQISFVSSAPLEEIHGTASGISGALSFIPDSPDSLAGRIEVDVRSMRTGISKRDKHLISEDWLDAEQFPSIVFVVRALEEIAQTSKDAGRSTLKAIAVGDFSLHGVTRPVSIPVEATYIVESDQTRKRGPGDFLMIKGAFDIALADFEVSGAKGIVGKRVGKVIQVEAQFFASSANAGAGGASCE